MNGSVRTWITRKKGEAYLLECLKPKLLSSKKTVMVWGAIWYGGKSKLVRFDCAESESARKGVTAKIYSMQISSGELRTCWTRVNNQWRRYGGAMVVEDGARIHTSPTNRDVWAKLRFVYLKHPPSSSDLNPIEKLLGLSQTEAFQAVKAPYHT